MERFTDRVHAGQLLGKKLADRNFENPLVLAIPRGGVPIGFEVAKILNCTLDILLVKKIGAPLQPELAIGAISEDAQPIYNDEIIKILNVSDGYIKEITAKKKEELQTQLKVFRGSKKPESINDKTVILVDDGIATGSTLKAAVQMLRQNNPRRIVIASPVGALQTIEKLKTLADDVVCLLEPSDLLAVGNWYLDFTQVEDNDVIRLLEESRLMGSDEQKEVLIHDGKNELLGDLTTVANPKGLIIFAHGSGSSRKSSRNIFVAQELNKMGFSTFLFDLLTEEESQDRRNVFNIDLLAKRLLLATDVVLRTQLHPIRVGYFGASTGAAAALLAASRSQHEISAVVSRGGRPDLAGGALSQVSAPTLLIVGSRDVSVLELNQKAASQLNLSKTAIVPNATHLFEEPGALDEVVEYAAAWFLQYLSPNLPKTSKEELVLEIEELARPIQGEHSWDQLINDIASSRIVMLGEATHGTQEFYAIRRMISERLIRDHGFKFIAVEGDWPDCQKLHEYIQSGKGESAHNIMRQFQRWPTWMWANDETASLIEWMKNYKAGFYGLDIYSLFESMDYVIEFAKNVDPDFAKSIRNNYSCFDPFERDEKAYASYLTKFPKGCKQEVLLNLREMLRLRVEGIHTESPELLSARFNARVVAHAEDYYRSMLFGGPESWNVRDQHMFETLELLLQQSGENSKCIVWAHNSHIGDYHATNMLEEGYINLGGLAREKFGMDKVSLVGFGTYEGQVLAGPAWDGKETITPLPAARQASFEDYCHKASVDLHTNRFYMLFDSVSREGNLGRRHYGHRAVGVVYRSQFEERGHNYVPTIPAKRYNAFVFIDKTKALKSIKTKMNPKDLPETWPGGL